MKALIAEVFTRFGQRKRTPLAPGWLTPVKPGPDPSAARAARMATANAENVPAKKRHGPGPPPKLGTLASPEYISMLNARVEQFKTRVAALERFKEPGKDNGKKQAKGRKDSDRQVRNGGRGN
jgi:hypothetical protein